MYKKIQVSFILFIAILISSCSSSTGKQDEDMRQKHQVANDSGLFDKKNIKEIKPSFVNINLKTADAFATVINFYLDIKNALADNNENEAQLCGNKMAKAFEKIDKSILSDEQKKIFEKEEDDLKENAEHIGESKIEHQRMHFSMLSQSVYTIATTFGGGKTLYHFYCKKAENNQGAMWLSDSLDIKNPYLGKDVDCTNIVEKISK